MEVLADNGRYVLAEDGPRLLFFQRRILPTWLAFVTSLFAFLLLLNSFVQFGLGFPVIGLVLGLAGALVVFAVVQVVRRRRAVRAVPLVAADAVVVLDREVCSLLDGAGRVLAPLDAVRVAMPMQLTSSARALRVQWPEGSVVVYRGDPISPRGTIAGPLRALRARGFAVG